jgi:hypothetical protein
LGKVWRLEAASAPAGRCARAKRARWCGIDAKKSRGSRALGTHPRRSQPSSTGRQPGTDLSEVLAGESFPCATDFLRRVIGFESLGEGA